MRWSEQEENAAEWEIFGGHSLCKGHHMKITDAGIFQMGESRPITNEMHTHEFTGGLRSSMVETDQEITGYGLSGRYWA